MPRYIGAITRSSETSSDLDFDLEHGEEELLAAALDSIEREHSTPPDQELDEYETHRILEQSVSPPPDLAPVAAERQTSAAPLEIKYEDIFDETFAGTGPHLNFVGSTD